MVKSALLAIISLILGIICLYGNKGEQLVGILLLLVTFYSALAFYIIFDNHKRDKRIKNEYSYTRTIIRTSKEKSLTYNQRGRAIPGRSYRSDGGGSSSYSFLKREYRQGLRYVGEGMQEEVRGDTTSKDKEQAN